MPPLSASHFALITPCASHGRDSFYIVESRSRQYYALVLGHIDMNSLSDSVMRQFLVTPRTSQNDLNQIKASTDSVLVLYMADGKKNLLTNVDRSVISVKDVSTTPHSLHLVNSLELETRAKMAIDSLEYISDADKAMLKSGPLGFEKSSLSRAASLPPIKPPPISHPLLLPTLTLFESTTSNTAWKIASPPSSRSPTWVLRNELDGVEKTVSYSDLWTILNISLRRMEPSQTAVVEDSNSEYSRLHAFASGKVHDPYLETSFPLSHSPILYRTVAGSDSKRGFVIHVLTPVAEVSDIAIATLDGIVDCPKLHVDSRFDDVTKLENSFKPGWAPCPFGIFPAPKPLNGGLLCQPARDDDPQARKCHLCHMNAAHLSAAQVRDHYNKQHAASVKSAILEFPTNLKVKQCDLCKIVFTSKGLPKHKQSCSCRETVCPIESCGKKMTCVGDSSLIHLISHLRNNHLDAEGAYAPTSAVTILTVKSLKFCKCPKHPLDDYHHSRLFAKSHLTQHLKPSKPASPTVGDGETWINAHAFVQRTLDSLNPEHASFKPVWGESRTRYFDYYANRNVSSSAFAAYDSLLDQLVSLPADDADEKATTLWFLVTYFDPLIFRGDKRAFTKNVKVVRDCINQRVAKLLNGDIEELWTSMLGKSETPLRPSSQTPKHVRVKDLMEKGRFSDAANEAVSDLKRPIMDDDAIHAFRDSVIPPSLHHQTTGVQPRSEREDPEVDPLMLTFTEEHEGAEDPDIRRLTKIISLIKKGKGAGFLGDTLDFYKVITRTGDTMPNLLELIRRILRGQLPPQIRPAFNLLAGSLFVKPDSEPVAYRPIGCPSALNRLVGKFFCSFTKGEVSKAMLKANQFAVGVKGGMTLLLASLQLLVQKHLNLDEDDWYDDDDTPAPSRRALFSLDLTSFFNVCDLDVFFSWVDNDPILSPYVPFLETRYKSASTYILKKDDGTFVHVTQPNGCAQGCTLAPLIASCCLLILISEFLEGNLAPCMSPSTAASLEKITHYTSEANATPAAIATNRVLPMDVVSALRSIRQQFVDSKRSHGEPILSYMDDMSTVACYSFILAFARFLVSHGPSAGVHVNWGKTQVLLGSHWDKHWRDVSEDGTTVRMEVDFVTALLELGIPQNNIISSPEHGPTKLAKLKGGVKILGAPFGYSRFNKDFRTKTLQKQMLAFDAISVAATDKEHLYKLIRHCVIPKVYHMFTASSSLSAIAEFAKACHAQHIIFFQRFLNDGKELDSDTEHSFELATLLIRQGGIQFTSPLAFYEAGFLASWSKLFFVGSPPSPDTEESIQSPIHPSISHIIASEINSPTLPCCMDYRKCFDKLNTLHPLEFGEEVAGGKGVPGLIMAAASDKLQHTIVEATSRNCFLNLHTSLVAKEDTTGVVCHLRKIMPSSAQFLGSSYLDNLDMGKEKMSSDTFHCYTKLKLGLPILDIPAGETLDCPFCSKSKSLNRFGEHIFSCNYFMSQRTACMHNPFRDTVAHVLGKLSKIGSPSASYISSVTIEKTGLVPNTALRPADVYATFSSEKQVLNQDGEFVAVTAVAFDITYATMTENLAHEGIQNTSSFSPAAFPHLLKAEATKRNATHDGRTHGGTAQYLADRSIAFVPIALDPLGGMGPQFSLVLHDTLTGRRIERALDGKACRVPAEDLAAANWVTPGRLASNDPTLYLPPFHPPSLNGQFKAAIDHLKKNANPGELPDNYHAHATVQRLALALSTRHVDGVATIARIFRSSISAAKGRTPKLPSLSSSDAYVEREASNASDFIRSIGIGLDVPTQDFDWSAHGEDDGAIPVGLGEGPADLLQRLLRRRFVSSSSSSVFSTIGRGAFSQNAHIDEDANAESAHDDIQPQKDTVVLDAQPSHKDSPLAQPRTERLRPPGAPLSAGEDVEGDSHPLHLRDHAPAHLVPLTGDAIAHLVPYAGDVGRSTPPPRHSSLAIASPPMHGGGRDGDSHQRADYLDDGGVDGSPDDDSMHDGLVYLPATSTGTHLTLHCSESPPAPPLNLVHLQDGRGELDEVRYQLVGAVANSIVPNNPVTSSSNGVRRLGLSHRDAVNAALELRDLRQNGTYALAFRLTLITDFYRLRIPSRLRGSGHHHLIRTLLQILDHSFTSVAILPREVIRTRPTASAIAPSHTAPPLDALELLREVLHSLNLAGHE